MIPPFVYGCMETKTLQDLRRHYKDLTAKLSELNAQVFPLRKRLNDVKMLIVQEIQGNLIRGRELYYLRGSKFIKVEYMYSDGILSRYRTATFLNPKTGKRYSIPLSSIFYLDGEEYKPILPERNFDYFRDPSDNIVDC